jgi:3-deoxy-D-manno-octulosonic-acid transferase
VKRVIDFVQPRLFLAMETELWPNFFHYLAQKGIPSAIINGRLSPKSYPATGCSTRKGNGTRQCKI